MYRLWDPYTSGRSGSVEVPVPSLESCNLPAGGCWAISSFKSVARYRNPDERNARFCKRTPHYLTSAEHCAVRLAGNFLWHLENHF